MIDNSNEWAKAQFGTANLGDPRRTSRLVKLAAALVKEPGKPIVQITHSPADMEGAYRFVRNENIQAKDIADAGFAATKKKTSDYPLLLALEDTTNLVYSHRSIHDDLGHVNNGNRSRGLLAHSVLLFAPNEKHIIGLIEQSCWTRDIKTRGKKRLRAVTPYKEKESYKWESASRNMSKRLHTKIADVISVCDREADIYEYLRYKLNHDQRFIVRSMQSRQIEEGKNKLYNFASALQSAGQKQVYIAQKGGRKAREATLDICFSQVSLKVPSNKKGDLLPLYYVGCSERNLKNSNLNWHLLTNEPVTTKEEALKIVSYYEQRWLVEEYHKAWKTDGTDVEGLRMQNKNNIERLATIHAFIAVRILQLKFANQQGDFISCEQILSSKAWKLLWLKRIGNVLPKEPPTMKWAYLELAKLGGWKDTKRNGQASIKRLWEGWFKLQTILEGYDLAMSLESDL